MKDKLLTQMIYRIVLCCVSCLATLLTFRFFHNVYVDGNHPDWQFVKHLDDLSWEFLKYYTNLSNWFVFGVSVVVCADTVKRFKAGETHGHNRKIRCLKFMTTVMILVTFVTYNFMLESMFTIRYWRNLYSLTCHVAAPLMFILDFFLFDEHGIVKVTWPLYSTIIPLIYCAIILIVGACTPNFKYPYFFLNVTRFGYGYVALMMLGMIVGFVGLGYLMWLYDKLFKVDGKWKLVFSKPRKASATVVETLPEETEKSDKIA